MHVDETLTNVQILGCDMDQNGLGSRVLPGPNGSYKYVKQVNIIYKCTQCIGPFRFMSTVFYGA